MHLLIAAILFGLAGQQAPRDAAAAAQAPKGTAVIRGRVVAPGTRTPIPGARVTLSGTAEFRFPLRSVYADSAGRFEFRELPGGRFSLSGTPLQYQLQFLPGPRTEIAVSDGQTVEGVELPLVRAGGIVGRLVDDMGQPVGGVSLQAQKVGEQSGMGSFASLMSDELGRFRLFHMSSGSYYLVARPQGAIDYGGPTTAGFLETFYPGVSARGEATRVEVRAGEDTEVGDLRLMRGRMIRVRGVVVDSQGRPAPGNRTMVTLSRDSGATGRGIDAQGRFEMEPEPPGRYRLSATLRSEAGQFEEFVAQSLTLTDADVDVVLATRRAITLTGRIVPDESVTATLPSSLIVRARSGTPSAEMPMDAPVTSAQTFIFPRLAGEVLLRLEGTGSSAFALQAVMRGSEDVTDIPTEFGADDQVRIMLTSRRSGLQGTVTADGGKPADRSAVIVFSEDRRYWVPSSTRVQADLRTDRSGHYVARVPAGRYYVVAVPVDRAMPLGRFDPAVLDALVPDATTVVVASDEIRVVDIRLTGPGGN